MGILWVFATLYMTMYVFVYVRVREKVREREMRMWCETTPWFKIGLVCSVWGGYNLVGSLKL